jgi:hypothetical protein
LIDNVDLWNERDPRAGRGLDEFYWEVQRDDEERKVGDAVMMKD